MFRPSLGLSVLSEAVASLGLSHTLLGTGIENRPFIESSAVFA